MRRAEMMTAGGVTLAGLGALVGLAIGSGEGTPKALAPRAQPVEVRTEVIRKTVNVYRREHPHHVTGPGAGGRGSSGANIPRTASALSAATRTRSSGAHAVAPTASAAPVVSTRSSGSHSTSGSTSSGRSSGGGSGSHTVKTRTSGSRPTSGSHAGGSGEGGSSSPPVKTRASGGSTSGGGSGASRPVSTRASGGGEGGDHGGGHDD